MRKYENSRKPTLNQTGAHSERKQTVMRYSAVREIQANFRKDQEAAYRDFFTVCLETADGEIETFQDLKTAFFVFLWQRGLLKTCWAFSDTRLGRAFDRRYKKTTRYNRSAFEGVRIRDQRTWWQSR